VTRRPQLHFMEWNGIRLEVTFEPEWLSPRILGEALSRSQLKLREGG